MRTFRRVLTTLVVLGGLAMVALLLRPRAKGQLDPATVAGVQGRA